MKSLFHTHPSLDDLEYYSGNHHRDDALIESVEEHLLLCEQCRFTLDQLEQEIRVLKIVLREAETGVLVH